jgi:hypothetical protein
MPFRWKCTNPSCGKVYSRHRTSIDTRRHVCSRCKSKLLYMGKFGQEGQLLVSVFPCADHPALVCCWPRLHQSGAIYGGICTAMEPDGTNAVIHNGQAWLLHGSMAATPSPLIKGAQPDDIPAPSGTLL